MRPWAFYGSAALAGVIGGGLWAWSALTNPNDIRNGAWLTSDVYGVAEADAATRARVARVGLFALAKEETVYFTAFEDDAGAPLDGACDYRLTGAAPEARWWSITAYGADHFLFDPPDGRYSIGAGDVGERIDVALTARPVEGAWLPTPDGAFSLTLRLYNPAPAVAADLGAAPLPSIVKEGC